MIRYHLWSWLHCRWITVTTTRAIWLATPRAVGVWACRGAVLGLGALPAGSGAYTPPAAMPGPPIVASGPGGYQPAFPAPWGYAPIEEMPNVQDNSRGEMGMARFPAHDVLREVSGVSGVSGPPVHDHNEAMRHSHIFSPGPEISMGAAPRHGGHHDQMVDTPEPGTLVILGAGLLALGVVRRVT